MVPGRKTEAGLTSQLCGIDKDPLCHKQFILSFKNALCFHVSCGNQNTKKRGNGKKTNYEGQYFVIRDDVNSQEEEKGRHLGRVCGHQLPGLVGPGKEPRHHDPLDLNHVGFWRKKMLPQTEEITNDNRKKRTKNNQWLRNENKSHNISACPQVHTDALLAKALCQIEYPPGAGGNPRQWGIAFGNHIK